jgi:electron transfer flavoprotein beta subunit
MNIYVCVKQVPDTEAKIELKGENGIDESGIKWIVSPYDEYGVEEALKLKEKLSDANVVIVCLGPERAQESIRMALAMGADRALHIVCEEFVDHLIVSKALAGAIKNDGEYKVIFTGKQAIDDDAYQVHIRMALHLGAAVATNVIGFEYGENSVQVSREIDEGAQEKIELKTPAVIGVTKGINTPRYPTLPNIMKAKKKEIKKLSLKEVGIEEIKNAEAVVKLTKPEEKSAGKVLEGEHQETVPQLVNLLKDEAKVI